MSTHDRDSAHTIYNELYDRLARLDVRVPLQFAYNNAVPATIMGRIEGSLIRSRNPVIRGTRRVLQFTWSQKLPADSVRWNVDVPDQNVTELRFQRHFVARFLPTLFGDIQTDDPVLIVQSGYEKNDRLQWFDGQDVAPPYRIFLRSFLTDNNNRLKIETVTGGKQQARSVIVD